MWDLFEKPWTSNFAKHFACFSLFMVLISTVTFVASTAEQFQASFELIMNHKMFEFLEE